MPVKLRNEPGARSLSEYFPHLDYLLIQIDDDQETDAGIVIPNARGDLEEHIKTTRPTGLVLKAGPGHYENGAFIEQPFHEGDYVYFRPSDYAAMAPQSVDIDGVEYALVRAQVVIGYVPARILAKRVDG